MTRPPNLARARRTASDLMVDTVVITRDGEGPFDDTLDETTLQLTSRPGEPATVYQGPGLVHPDTGGADSGSQRGGQTTWPSRFDLRLPADADTPRPGDRVIVDTAASDPALEGAEFTVTEVAAATFTVTRRCKMTRRVRGPAE